MMSAKKNMPDSIQFLVSKSCISIITISIGLWCGSRDSHTAFYIAALVQALNNGYDSFFYLAGYNRFITFFHLLSFIAAACVFAVSIMHFSGGDFTQSSTEWMVVIGLCIPVAHYLSEIVWKFLQGKY